MWGILEVLGLFLVMANRKRTKEIVNCPYNHGHQAD